MAVHLRVISFLCNQSDVLTGILYNGRPEVKDAERVPGLFLNTLPCRMQMSGGPWIDLCERVFALEQELLPFRRYPLAELMRKRGRLPLFDTVFNFTYFHIYEGLNKLENLKVLNAYASEHTYFDLTVQFNLDHSTSEPQLRLALDYRTSRFAEAQMLKIGSYYLSTMTAMIKDPHSDYLAALSAVPLQSDLLSNQTANELALSGHSENLEEVLRLLEPLSDSEVRNILRRKRALHPPQNA
jgi:non-ribosomal peptide synthetase component F